MTEGLIQTYINRWGEKLLFRLPMKYVERCSRSWIRCFVPDTSEVMGFTNIDDYSSIGDYTFVNRFCEVTRATIGNYCSIGSGVRIGSGEHDLSLASTSAFVTGHIADDLTLKDCKIGHDVWIGTQAFVKRGVFVGNGAVIGAHSVVTKDVPAFAIVVGSPAKIVRYRFSEEDRVKVLSSEWWNRDLTQAKRFNEEFQKSKRECDD